MTGGAGSLGICRTMPTKSPACDPWSTASVRSCVPAGRIDELTMVRNRSP
ncbi:Uncharacterised protein [Mycobacteroides abscessus subsp. abscessus]|nr:Uncharacterised protein [Mycobacteroides abscessus subsp. abscessus]